MKLRMKLVVIGLFFFMFLLVGCQQGNRQRRDTTWNFNRAYVMIGNETFEVEVESWLDFDESDMIQIRTPEGRTYLTHSMNIILIQD